jgi:cytochrome d ubiquinol oxidase subunit I
MFVIAAFLVFITSLAQPVIGHSHIVEVNEYQPEKAAAYEGIFRTQKGAPLIVFGIPDAEHGKIDNAINIPYMLSFLDSFTLDSEVKGLNDFPKEDWPPVNTIFITFHLMVPLGIALIGVSALGLFFFFRKNLEKQRWLLRIVLICVPFPYLANELGWIGTEIGRQPWTIWKILRTSQASSVNVPGEQVLASLIILGLVWISVLAVFFVFVPKIVKKGFPSLAGAKKGE